jgi:hypothetical protein
MKKMSSMKISRSLARERNRNKMQSLLSTTHDQEYLEDTLALHNYEKLMEKQVKNRFKRDYTDFNVQISKNKHRQKQQAFDARKQEKFEFFPFNEGETVERNRAEQKKVLNQELRERSRQVENMPKLLSGKIQPRDLSTKKPRFQSETASPMGQHEPPPSFTTGYPRFLEPHKHYPYRRLNDTHIEKVMQEAVKRVEEKGKFLITKTLTKLS